MTDEVDSVVTVDTITEVVTEGVVEAIHTIDTLEVFETERIVESETLSEVLETKAAELIIETVQAVEILTEGIQGVPGPPGIVEEDIVYAKRIDMVSAELLYRGEAAVGSSETEPVWRIRRVTLPMVGDIVDVTEQWADGTANFSYRWSERASLNYV